MGIQCFFALFRCKKGKVKLHYTRRTCVKSELLVMKRKIALMPVLVTTIYVEK